MRILITGASGYIGARLTRLAVTAGHTVRAAVRQPRRAPALAGVELQRFDLAQPRCADTLVRGCDAVVHLAVILDADSQPAGASEDLNVSGTRTLLTAARRAGVRRFIFLSSQSARPGAPTRYGRSKWAIEQMLDGAGEVSVTPGMVSGGAPRGVYGQLVKVLKRLPLLPVPRPGAPVYPVHVDDVCRALIELATGEEDPPGRLRVAPRRPERFIDYLRTIAHRRLGRHIPLVPVPGWLPAVAARLASLLPFLPRISKERTEGLAALQPMADDGTPYFGGFEIRPLAAALAAEGARRTLLAEGRQLSSYAVGRSAPWGIARRYARALLQRSEEALDPPPGRFLRLCEPLDTDSRLRRRLQLATRIAEMTPEAAPRFHNYERRGRLTTYATVGWTLVVEAALLPLRFLLGRWRRD